MIERTELIPRTTLTEMVTAWREVSRKIREGYALLAEAETDLKRVFGDKSYRYDMSGDRYRCFRFEKPEETIKEVKKDVWRSLIDRMELRRVLSIKRAEELDKQLETGDGLPDIDETAILAMVESSFAQVPMFIEEAIREVYDWLIPRMQDGYVTNKRGLVGHRVIKRYVIRSDGWVGKPQVNYNYEKELRALDNVFRALDGNGTIKNHQGPLIQRINSLPAFGVFGETDYFRVKGCKNGNLHMEFRRQDLLDKFNLVAGGARLAAPTEKKV